MSEPEKTIQSNLSGLRTSQDRIENLPAINAGVGSLQSFELLQRQAKMISSSSIIPKEYVGNVANCAVALEIANRIGCGYMQVMQNLDVIHGRPAWRAKFLISTVNTCGRFSAIRFEFFGTPNTDGWGCRAWAIEKSTNEKLFGPDITIKLAKDEKWYDKPGSKWKSIPQKMLMYRAGAWWSDLYAPELAMGLQTREEVFDVWDAEKLGDGSFSVNLESLRADAQNNNAPAVNAETGEIIENTSTEPTKEPAQPIMIPAKALPGDATQTDWDSWVAQWEGLVAEMTDEQSLNKLRKLNVSILGNLGKINPPKHAHCLELFSSRMVAVGANQAAA